MYTSLVILLSWIVLSCTSPSLQKTTPVKKTAWDAVQLQPLCSIGQDIQSVYGRAFLKIHSADFSRQFAADVTLQDRDHLKLEVTNFLGGSEVIITLEEQKINLWQRGDPQFKNITDQWEGVPLHWILQLFLGKIPCPKQIVFQKNEATQELLVKNLHEKYTYHFEYHSNQFQLDSLKWSFSNTKEIEFHFTDWDKDTLSPRKWEMISPKGSISVHWGKRVVQHGL